MTDPFEFQWGPDLLAGLGVHLSPDQEACTTTTGYAIAVVPMYQPGESTSGGLYAQMKDHHGILQVEPLVVAIHLNEEDGCHGDLQAHLDRMRTPSWRKFAQAVGVPLHEHDDPYVEAIAEMAETDNENWPVWDAVMIGESQAASLARSIRHAYSESLWDTLDEFYAIANNGLHCECGDDSHEDCGWPELADELGIDPTIQNGFPIDEPSWDSDRIIPDFREFMTDENRAAWDHLTRTSPRHWQQFETSTGLITPRRVGLVQRPPGNPKTNPWK